MGVTISAAIQIIAQMAHARFFHRLRLRGEISEEEWQHRIRQPMHLWGPANLRPFLDPHWYNNGGDGEMNVATIIWQVSLPFMPACRRPVEEWGGYVPPFEDMLSKKRFALRANIAGKKLTKQIRHPLFLEMHAGKLGGWVHAQRLMGLDWRNGAEKTSRTDLPPHFTYSNFISSVGNVSAIIPTLVHIWLNLLVCGIAGSDRSLRLSDENS